MAGVDDDFPSTQPAISVLMDGVVAYVEVRSGHDNRSRGIKAHLRNLGATVVDSLSNEVTHVVFNEGLPSTYKRAKQLRCHLVSVLWIEACKELMSLAPEAEYPPIGQQKYEDPLALKNFKKMKSMQPDCDEEVSNQKIDKILKNIQRRTTKPRAHPKQRYLRRTEPENSRSMRSTNAKPTKKQKKHNHTGRKKSEKVVKEQVFFPSDSEQSVAKPRTEQHQASVNETHSQKRVSHSHPESLKSDCSNSSSVIFCGIESNAASGCTENFRDKFRPSKPRCAGDLPMSRNEFVSRLSDLVQILRRDSENSDLEENCKLTSLKSSCDKPVMSEQSTATALRRHQPSKSLFKEKCSQYPSTRSTKGVECVSASAFLLQRRLRAQCVKEDSAVLSQECDGMSSLEDDYGVENRKHNRKQQLGQQKAQGDLNGPEDQATFSQVMRSYEAFAKHQKNPELSKSSELARSCIPIDFKGFNTNVSFSGLSDSCALKSKEPHQEDNALKESDDRKQIFHPEETYHSEARSSVSIAGDNVLINGNSSNRNLPTDFGEEDCPLFSYVERSVSQTSGKENFLTANNGGMSESSEEEKDLLPKLWERSPSPVFIIKKPKLRRPFKSQRQATSKNLSNQGDRKNILNNQVTSLYQPLRDSAFYDCVKEENRNDPAQCVNKTVHSVKCKFLQSMEGTPNKTAVEGIVLAEDTPEISPHTLPHCSGIVIPPTPGSSYSPLSLPNNIQNDVPSSPHMVFHATSLSSHNFKNELSINGRQKESPKYLPGGGNIEPVNVQRSLLCSTAGNGEKRAIVNNGEVTQSMPFEQQKAAFKSGTKVFIPLRQSTSSGYESSDASLQLCTSSDSENTLCTRSRRLKRKNQSMVVAPKKRSEVYEDSSTSEGCKRLTRSKSGCLTPTFTRHCVTLSTAEEGTSSGPQRRGRSRVVDLNRTCPEISFAQPMHLRSHSFNGSQYLSQERNCQNSKKVIVFTFLTASEQHAVESSLQALPGWVVEAKVSARTTHVVNSSPKRTLNMLKGMARGCWLVHQNWIHESAKSGVWLEEEKFELVDFSPAVKEFRSKRQFLGSKFQNALFSSVGPIFIFPKISAPPAKDLRELIQLCGGVVAARRQKAHLVVGADDRNVHSVQALWVLDCISKNKILPINEQYEIRMSCSS